METPTQTIASMFDRTSPRYDFLNSLMSLGQDATWRQTLAELIEPGERVLDVCCGSARSSVAAHRKSGRAVVGVDASAAMLASGREHASRVSATVLAVQADAFQLPFQAQSFDTVTVAWGLRNLLPERKAIDELTRVLRPNGRLLVLDSPSPAEGWKGKLHRFYLQRVVPVLGRISPDAEAYRYLAESVLHFGNTDQVAGRLRSAGLRVEQTRTLFFGAAAVWSARVVTVNPLSTVQTARKTEETLQAAMPDHVTVPE